jgi:hypothetical protein
MAAVALEGLSPEASLAALQQLNYDFTMQVGFQESVGCTYAVVAPCCNMCLASQVDCMIAPQAMPQSAYV